MEAGGGLEEHRQQEPRAQRREQERPRPAVRRSREQVDRRHAARQRARDREKQRRQPSELFLVAEGYQAQDNARRAFDGRRRQERPARKPRRRRVQSARARRRKIAYPAGRQSRQTRRDEQ